MISASLPLPVTAVTLFGYIIKYSLTPQFRALIVAINNVGQRCNERLTHQPVFNSLIAIQR